MEQNEKYANKCLLIKNGKCRNADLWIEEQKEKENLAKCLAQTVLHNKQIVKQNQSLQQNLQILEKAFLDLQKELADKLDIPTKPIVCIPRDFYLCVLPSTIENKVDELKNAESERNLYKKVIDKFIKFHKSTTGKKVSIKDIENLNKIFKEMAQVLESDVQNG